MAIGSCIQFAFTFIYVSMAYFRKPGPTDNNYERSHILSKSSFFLLRISLGAVDLHGHGPPFSLLPH